jgi:hypothetical protein
MHDGSISENRYGAGVTISGNSNFTLNGGKINDNDNDNDTEVPYAQRT